MTTTVADSNRFVRKGMSLFCLLLFLFDAGFSSADDESALVGGRPNIVLFFVDDLGWSDLGFRNPTFETPSIDALSRDGLNFTEAYSPSPTCSPSRAALLTGKHPARLRMVRHIPNTAEYGFDEQGRPDSAFHVWKKDPAKLPSANWLGLEHTTYAEALKQQGYYNLFIGKWHLGYDPYHPVQQGFDRQIGMSNRGHPKSYFPPYFGNSSDYGAGEDRYLTDKLTDEAVSFIESYEGDAPFMLSFWYYGVHTPHEGRQDLVEHFEQKGLAGRDAVYAAMVSAVDESVGRVREALQAKDIDKNTVIIFLSDQGSFFDNPPFRGGKLVDTLYDGGARIPMIVYWDGVTSPGAENASPVNLNDILPTLVELAGDQPGDYPDLDGVSLLETIRTNESLDRGGPIFGYRAYEDLYASVRDGDWKLLAYRSGRTALHRLSDDVEEANDLSADYPEVADVLRRQLIDWEVSMGLEEYSGAR